MQRRKIHKGAKLIWAILGIGLYIYLFRLLWNFLMPEIFELPCLTFWKAAGLLLLFKMLFLGSGWHHYAHHKKQQRKENWKNHFSNKWGMGDCRQSTAQDTHDEIGRDSKKEEGLS